MVHLLPEEAAKRGIEIATFTQELSGVDRAILESMTEGFARVHVQKGRDKIVGATIVAENAGDMISEGCLAMTAGVAVGATEVQLNLIAVRFLDLPKE